MELEVEFKFVGEQNGMLMWELDYTEQHAICNRKTQRPHSDRSSGIIFALSLRNIYAECTTFTKPVPSTCGPPATGSDTLDGKPAFNH